MRGQQSFTGTGVFTLTIEDAVAKEIMIQLGGTFVATVQLQVSIDGVNWAPVEMVPVGGGAASVDMTAAGVFVAANPAAVRPAPRARVEVTAFTSGQVDLQVSTVRKE